MGIPGVVGRIIARQRVETAPVKKRAKRAARAADDASAPVVVTDDAALTGDDLLTGSESNGA